MPCRVVVVRLHAFGDAVITLPVLRGLRRALPDARIEMVTSPAYREMFDVSGVVDATWGIETRNAKPARLLGTARAAMRIGTPDLMIDLQRSRVSELLRRMLRPPAWCAFDRFAPAPALERYLDAVRWVGINTIEPICHADIPARLQQRARQLLVDHSASETFDELKKYRLVCLNPAGCWVTKQWPVGHYIELARMLIDERPTTIVLLGTENVRAGARRIAEALPAEHLIDLVDRTTPAEALAVVNELDTVISDDSGLMHLAWTSGVPTVAMFGASRSTWSAPQGSHTHTFSSEDLECGACMSPSCARGDLLCLHRVKAETVRGLDDRTVGRPDGQTIRR